MKKLPLLLLLFAAACSSNNNSSNTSTSAATAPAASSDTVVVSMEGMGDLKVEATIDDIEKVLHRSFHDAAVTADSRFPDSINVRYKNADYAIWFSREPKPDNDSAFEIDVLQMISSSPLLKTTAGIRIGDDLQKLLKAYADSSEAVTVEPALSYDKNYNATRIKGKAQVHIGGIVGSAMTFFIVDNKVGAIRVSFGRHAE